MQEDPKFRNVQQMLLCHRVWSSREQITASVRDLANTPLGPRERPGTEQTGDRPAGAAHKDRDVPVRESQSMTLCIRLPRFRGLFPQILRPVRLSFGEYAQDQ